MRIKNPVEAICSVMGSISDSHLREAERQWGPSVCYGSPFTKGFQYHMERLVRKNGWKGTHSEFLEVLALAVRRFEEQWWEYTN